MGHTYQWQRGILQTTQYISPQQQLLSTVWYFCFVYVSSRSRLDLSLSLSHLLHSAGRPALPSSLAPTDQRLLPTQSAIQVLLIISKGGLDGGQARFFFLTAAAATCRYSPLDLCFFFAVLTEI